MKVTNTCTVCSICVCIDSGDTLDPNGEQRIIQLHSMFSSERIAVHSVRLANNDLCPLQGLHPVETAYQVVLYSGFNNTMPLLNSALPCSCHTKIIRFINNK